MKTSARWYAALGLGLIGIGIGVGVDRTILAQQTGVTRTILSRTPDPGNPAYEAVVASVELAPAASSGKHRHHGVEIGYVLDGSVLLEHEGSAPVTLTRGSHFVNDAAHNARNPGTAPVKLWVIYLVEKDKPLAVPVP